MGLCFCSRQRLRSSGWLTHPSAGRLPAEEEQVEVCQSFLSAKAKAPLEPQPEAAEEMAAA